MAILKGKSKLWDERLLKDGTNESGKREKRDEAGRGRLTYNLILYHAQDVVEYFNSYQYYDQKVNLICRSDYSKVMELVINLFSLTFIIYR